MKPDQPIPSAPLPKLFEGLVTRDDLARHLGISTDTLARWEGRGTGPTSIKVGRRVLYRAATVNAWLRGLERPRPTPAKPASRPGAK
jgi:predicted DNA-binding transcriptional regulator AlpA